MDLLYFLLQFFQKYGTVRYRSGKFMKLRTYLLQLIATVDEFLNIMIIDSEQIDESF